MTDLQDELEEWRRAALRAAVARVVDLDATTSRAAEPALAVNERGETVGSLPALARGPIRSAVVAAALDVLREGRPRLMSFGCPDDQSAAVGIYCGPRLHVFLEPVDQ